MGDQKQEAEIVTHNALGLVLDHPHKKVRHNVSVNKRQAVLSLLYCPDLIFQKPLEHKFCFTHEFFLCQVNHVLDLHPADHIAFPRFLSPEADWFKLYWHHAIIEDIDYESELIRVIHFQPTFDSGFTEQRDNENNQLELFNSQHR